jgi:hypothetical protein
LFTFASEQPLVERGSALFELACTVAITKPTHWHQYQQTRPRLGADRSDVSVRVLRGVGPCITVGP